MTLLSANDRFEILDLCSRYHRSMDNADEEAVMDCWARAGITFENPTGKFTNWDQLRKQLSRDLHGGPAAGKRTVLFNVVIHEGDSVDSALVDSEYLVLDTQSLQIVETGSFKSDRVSRTSMGWRFLSRSQKADKRVAPTKSSTPAPAEVRSH